MRSARCCSTWTSRSALNRSGAEPDVAVALGGTYHNLLRMWATP
ncbi:MAG: hypothetical protein U1F75_08340 [Plasticicumulans sp.]